jgi:inorganic pyrophosphatase
MNNIVDAIIEIPMGTKNKYEIDTKTGKIRLNRVQYSSMTYPAEYGFIDNTIALDNDPLDILVLTSEPTFPGCIIESKIIGYLDTIDNGHKDPKIIAVNNVDPRYNHFDEIESIHESILNEIKNFFQNYKQLQNIEVKVFDFHNKDEALKILEECYKRKDV